MELERPNLLLTCRTLGRLGQADLPALAVGVRVLPRRVLRQRHNDGLPSPAGSRSSYQKPLRTVQYMFSVFISYDKEVFPWCLVELSLDSLCGQQAGEEEEGGHGEMVWPATVVAAAV